MKGIFNKALVVALLASVSGVRAGGDVVMSSKQLLAAAAVQFSAEAKNVAVAGLTVVKNSAPVHMAARAGKTIATGAVAVVNDVANDFGQLGKSSINGIYTAGSTVASFTKAAFNCVKSVPQALVSLPQNIQTFYGKHTYGCNVAAGVVTYVGVVAAVATAEFYLLKYLRTRRYAQNQEASEKYHAQQAATVKNSSLPEAQVSTSTHPKKAIKKNKNKACLVEETTQSDSVVLA